MIGRRFGRLGAAGVASWLALSVTWFYPGIVQADAIAEHGAAQSPRTLYNIDTAWQSQQSPVEYSGGAFGQAVVALEQGFLASAPGCPTTALSGCIVQLDKRGEIIATLITPKRTADDRIGAALAASRRYIAVGAPGADQVLLYDSSGELQQTLEHPGVSADSDFGASLALIDGRDGGWLAVGARGTASAAGEPEGAVYLYKLEGRRASLSRRLSDPTPTGADRFGSSLVFLAAGKSDRRGSVDPIIADSLILLVGAPGDNSNSQYSGQVHMFSSSSGKLLHTLEDPTPSRNDLFGASLAVGKKWLAVGAPRHAVRQTPQGEVHLFSLADLNQSYAVAPPLDILNQWFGQPLAMRGDLLLVGATTIEFSPGRVGGRVYSFDTRQAGSSRVGVIAPHKTGNLEHFGAAFAISGNTLMVGVPGSAGQYGGSGRVDVCRRCSR